MAETGEEQSRRFFDEAYDRLTTDIRNLLQAEYWHSSPVIREEFHHPALAALAFLIGTQIMRIRDPEARQKAVELTIGAVGYGIRNGLRGAEEAERMMAEPVH
jgi:hypothetical protein